MHRSEATKAYSGAPMGEKNITRLDNKLPRPRTVVMIVANIKQFRFAFYEQLEQALQNTGIRLHVIYSEPAPSEQSKGDSRDLPSPLGIKTPRAYCLKERILLQYLPISLLWRADLVVMVQSNGYLANFALHLARWLGWRRVAYWGHGYNHQGMASSLAEKIKRRLACHVDWWFTYTHQTGKYLHDLGFPSHKISVIENAVDTSKFAHAVANVPAPTLNALRSKLHLPEDACVGIYCGSLYADKQLEFLLDAAKYIHHENPSFRLLIIGDGPQRQWLIDTIRTLPWIHYGGAQFGEYKAAYFALSHIFLNPGLVGLAILDSFAAGLPFITTQYEGHSPEVCYLEHGSNGLMLPFDRHIYAQSIADLTHNPGLLARLKQGALKSAQRYTVENMVSNVTTGIQRFFQGQAAGNEEHN
ncbi:MAG TPA: glycosyltransferase family 4 protein [Polaromonas sp.]|nr:glycosyltransferase family 4 protein [Polaromonas sp.]